MGRARFLFYTRFIFNRAAWGRGRGSWFTRGSFFFSFVGDQTKTPLGRILVGTLNRATCNVYSPKAFEALIHKNVTHIVFFIVCEIYFLLVLSTRSIRSERTRQNVQGLRHW